MRAVAYRLRCVLRVEWRTTIWLTLVVAVTCGAVLAIACGAARTASAPDRYTTASGIDADASVMQDGGAARTEEIAKLPGTVAVEGMTFVFGGLVPTGGDEPVEAIALAGTPGAAGGRIDEGRAADPGKETEFVATRNFVEGAHTHIGDTFTLITITQKHADTEGFGGDPDGPTIKDMRLVGVIDSPSQLEDPSAYAVLSKAVLDNHVDEGLGVSGSQISVELEPGVTVAEFRDQLDSLPGGDQFQVERAVVIPDSVKTAVDAQSTALWLLALVTGLAVVVVVGQIITRQVRQTSGERERLYALGFTARQSVAETVGRLAVPLVAGLVAATGLAVLASGLFPTGLAGRIDPDAGLRVEPLVIVIVAIVLFVGFLAWTVTALAMGRRMASERTSTPVVDGAASRVASVAASVGLRFAFTRNARDRSSVSASVAGVTLALAGVVAALVFSSSLDGLTSEPHRWGNDYDIAIGQGEQEISKETQSVILHNPDVAGLTIYKSGDARRGSVSVPIVGARAITGHIDPPVLEGRSPAGRDEIGLGRLTAHDLGLDVGDTVRLTKKAEDGKRRSRTLVVSGIVVVPGTGAIEGMGEGALMTSQGLATLDPDASAATAAVDLRPGADVDVAARRLVKQLHLDTNGEEPEPGRPARIQSVSQVRSVPVALAAMLGALAMLTIAHVMLISVHRRRHDVAVLRTLGTDRRCVARTVHWQATAFTALAVVLGVPSGLIVGRLVFTTFASRMGAVDDPVVPFALIGAAALAAILLANIVAIATARRTRKLSPAAVLRTE